MKTKAFPVRPMLAGVLLAVLLMACTPQQSVDSATSTVPFNFNTTLDVQELMRSVIEPSADILWDNAGWIESAAGYEELYPTSDDGWAYVRAQAAILVESGNMLALPGRAVDDEAWLVYSEALTEAGLRAMRAAETHTEEDFFQAGAQLYSVCTACHQAYNPDILSRFVTAP
jgi:hypothetical protein